MNYSEFNVSHEPSIADLEKIEKWLKEDLIKRKSSFYKNWTVITSCLESKELSILRNGVNTIGFVTWTGDSFCAKIDIMNISSEYTGLGLGKYFFNEMSDFLKLKGFLVLKLFCEPKSSEGFWKKVGFLRFPNQLLGNTLDCYKPLIETLKPSNQKSKNRIELWDVHYGYLKMKPNEPKWVWNVESKTTLETTPIIYPCNSEWNIRLVKDDTDILGVTKGSISKWKDKYPEVFT